LKRSLANIFAGGDTLIVGGLFSEHLLDSGLTSELERRGATILLPDPSERKLKGNTYEDVGPTFTEKTIEAISNAQTVFWEGPLGRYRDPHSNSLRVAQAITRWAEDDPKRRAFISGGSTSFLFKEANGWDENKRAEARGITVSTGGGTSIFYFAHRGRLPGTEGLRGWEPKGHVDLNNYPNFWRDILKDPRTFGYVFVVDKNGNYEAHSRRILPGKYGSDLFNDVTQMLILQERVNVGFGSTVDASGVPVPGRFFVTEGHQDFVVFDKDGNPHLLGENENPADRLLNSETVLAAIQNPDRAKRSGSEPGKTRDAAEKDPEMRVLTAESILKKFPLEVFFVWKSKSGTEWWGTGNRAAYYSNDPNGNPLEQVDHVTFSSSVDGKSQSEIGSLETLRDLMDFSTVINSSNDLVGRPKFRLAGNSWYAKNKDKKGAEFKAGASQNVRHAHALRVIFPVEHAPRQMVGKVQNVDVSVLSDPDNGPGLVLEADFVHLGDLIQVAHRAIGNIVERGHAFNYIIVPTESGFRIFIGDKIQGVPDVRFKNESAFAELGRLMIIDPPELFYRLTPDQMAEIEKLAKEAEEQNKKLNLSPWVKKEKKAGRLEVVDPNLFQDSLAALRSVSAPAQEILKLAEWLVHSPGRSRGPPPSAQGGGTAKNKALSRKEDLAQRIGGKAHGLTILSEVPGVRVPAWDVLPVDVFDEFLRDNPSVGELISKLGSHQDESERGALLEKIRLQIEEAPISPKLLEKIAGLYKDVINRSGNSGARVSVRSSSPAEDQKTASFAGQYKTVLHIRGEEFVVKAVKEVWASTFSSDAVRYRVEQANGDVWAPMAVIIQVMVNARSAGTAFTVDLETGAPFYSINATYGAGESEVAGKVTPDRFIVDPGSLEIIKRRLGDKKEKISPPLPGQEGPRIETTSPEERIKFALESSEVRSIAEGLSAIKGHFEKVSGATSFDVEYAVDLDGNLFFLQCRPETVWSKNPPKRRAVEASRAPRIPATHMGGLTATPGVVRGTLRVISEVGEPGVRRAERLVQDGDILVVTHTTNIWERVLAKAGGVLTDTGGPGCHTAVIARESQKPAVVGTGTAVKTLSQFDGQRVTLDATNRIIYLGAVPEEAITEASVGTPQYGGLDSESEDVTWQEVLRSGTAIDRGDGQRWIGKPAYALTAFMSDVYSSGHQLMASLLEIPTRLDFADGIHLIHFSDLSRWREKLRSMNLEQLENMHQDRIRTSTDYLRLSKEFNPTLVDFRAWLQLYTRLNSYIAVGYAFSRVTEGLMEEALKNKKLVEPYFSEVRTGMAGRVGETEATQFLRSYKGLLEDLKANEKLKLALMAVIETKSWEPLRGEDESFYRTFEQVAYKFKITPRTEPIVGLLEPFEVLARRLLQDAKENRQIFIPTHESEDFFPEDERFTRTVLLAVGSEKAREDAHHQKMRGLWMFRARMEPFTQWLIREGKIKEYEDVFSHPVKWVENELGVFEQKRKNLSLDSLLSRFFKVMEEGGESPVASKMWRVGRWVNDFVAAPIYETALFFLLPAMSGSVPILMIGLLIFVALHDWDDYQAGKSSGLSPPAAREKSMRRAVARFWRAMILYAMPFALFLVPSELIPLLEPFGFGSLLSLAQESSLFEIAGTVALLHSSRNFINTGYVVLKKKFPSLGSRKDTSLLVLLFGLPIVASASSLVENPSLPFLFLAALPWPTILGALGGVALVSGAVILSHVIFRSGGQASDEIEAIDHILGSGLPHRVTTPLLLHAATHTENEEVARLAVRPLIAPWRNLNIDLSQAKDRFTKRGWTSLAKEVSGEWNSDTKWLEALAGSDARHMADVVFLEEDPFVSGNQDASLKTLNEVFPAIGSLNVGTLGSPGLNQIHNIGLDIIKPEYETAFKENIRSFYSDLKVSDSEDVPPVPTVNQSLARLRKFVASEVKPGTDENKVPVQLEVYTLADIEIARETIQLLQRINEGEENPVRLLLAGVDHATVTALREAANGFANVAVAEFPVATQIEETGAWNLETSSLNNQFEGLKMFLGIGDDFALEVSLSETISVDKRTLESQDTEKFNEALKQALLRFILNEPRPFHFNTMLKIIQAIKQSA
jgi:phosphohistidine swiveling domain-containing protein